MQNVLLRIGYFGGFGLIGTLMTLCGKGTHQGALSTIAEGLMGLRHPPESATMGMAKPRKLSMPAQLRKEVTEHCRSIARKYGVALKADRDLKARVLRLERALLPPRPRRRGRPKNPIVSRAIALYRKLRRESPQASSRQLWSQVYPRVIEGWETMSEPERRGARDQLRERITWRLRKRRKIPAEISIS